MCASFINQILASVYNTSLRQKTRHAFFVYAQCPSKVFIPSQRQMRTLYCVGWCLRKCVANHIINPHDGGQKVDRCDPVACLFWPEPAPSFLSPSFQAPSLLQARPPRTLMTSLTHNPSVGNYNICRNEKAAHKDGSGTGGNPSSPLIMSGLGLRREGGGAVRCCWGRVGGRGGGDHFVQ